MSTNLNALSSRLQALGGRTVAESREPRAESSDDKKLRKVANDMQGVFVEQLFKAMRATVPEGGALSGGSGEEMFTGLMDSHVASETPSQWNRGLGEAIYRQLRAGVHGTAAPGTAAPGTAAPATPAPAGMPVLPAQITTNASAPVAVEDRR